jgi:cbb3-type cytochrome oxidase subunit 3
MKQTVLSQFDMPWLPITGLVLFFMCFGLYTYWTFKQSNKEHYQEASLIPLQDEEKESK